MNELAAAGAAVSSLNAAFNLTKTFLDVQGAVKVQAKVVELQSQILSAQQSAMTAQQTQTALIDRVKDLEAEVARLKKWDTDKDQYHLEQVGSAGFVYSPKAEPDEANPNHWLCVHCFERGQRALLQDQGRVRDDPGVVGYICPSCKTTTRARYTHSPQSRGKVGEDGKVRK
jgi:hypothetical protein